MVSEEYGKRIHNRSVIRECFEYSKARAAEVGSENVFDFSIGNPNVPPPQSVTDAAQEILSSMDPVEIHGYPSVEGIPSVRRAIADSLNARYGMQYTEKNIFMTNGAAAALSLCFRALTDFGRGDEIITFAPYFPEYAVFVKCSGAELTVIPPEIESFQIDFEALAARISPKTKAILINSPNNPSGAVYSETTVRRLAALLEEKQREVGHSIYIISDEPYREIVFRGFTVPYVPKYYKNTLVCYSYSKSLSLPGERIGYVAFSDETEDAEKLSGVLAGAARDLAYVGVPTLFQLVIGRCAGETSDLAVYQRNKDILYNGLRTLGYQCVEPGGTFYAFPRSPEPDAEAFCARAREYDLVLVPGDGFGCPGHVRIAFCTATEKVERSLERFEQLIRSYRTPGDRERGSISPRFGIY